ncbi:hypothetical protein INT44_002652 [Umbelopsis vinacea]|uniref:Uncharacterized protein n=1 Tax=Umbelopsis vinacea TaxID=44442 RepID=A0A8H7PEU3_9FUNG|nr:hypothetical protein INT44_002652 [Umbelopsis vinacea]
MMNEQWFLQIKYRTLPELVLKVSSGPAGLPLAQYLKTHRVPFRNIRSHLQGYSVALHFGISYITQAMGLENMTTFAEKTSVIYLNETGFATFMADGEILIQTQGTPIIGDKVEELTIMNLSGLTDITAEQYAAFLCQHQRLIKRQQHILHALDINAGLHELAQEIAVQFCDPFKSIEQETDPATKIWLNKVCQYLSDPSWNGNGKKNAQINKMSTAAGSSTTKDII